MEPPCLNAPGWCKGNWRNRCQNSQTVCPGCVHTLLYMWEPGKQAVRCCFGSRKQWLRRGQSWHKFWSWYTGLHVVGCQMSFSLYAESCRWSSERNLRFSPTAKSRYLIQGQGRHLDVIPALGHDNMWNNWTGLASLMEIKLQQNDIRPYQSQNFINTAQKATAEQPFNICFPPMIGNSPCWSFYLVMTIYFPIWFCWTA